MSDIDAGTLLQALLGADKQARESSPYSGFESIADSLSGSIIGAHKDAPGKLSLKDSLISSLVLGGIGGLANLGTESYVERQNNLAAQTLRQAITGNVFTKPEGMNASIFNTMKNTGELHSAARTMAIQDADIAAKADAKKAFITAFANANTPQQQERLLKMGKAMGLLPKGAEQAFTAEAEPIAIEPDTSEIFPGGAPSLKSTFKDTFNEFVAQGATPNAAADAATTLTAAQRKAMTGSVDHVANARKQANAMLELAQTAEAGALGAGQTGGVFGGVRDLGSKVAAFFGNDDQTEKQTSQSLLDSVKPDVIKASRAAGAGAMSDPEMRLYVGAGPGSDKTPEANALLIEKLKNVATIQLEYADFLETYREEKGTVQGAEKLWQQYKQANPLFVRQGNELILNTERPSWQDYFMQGQAAPTQQQKYTVQDAAAAGYSAADIAALKQQGLIE